MNANLLRCMSQEVAHRVSSPTRINSVAIRDIADMREAVRPIRPDANGPISGIGVTGFGRNEPAMMCYSS
jgi:hypothetical protein